MELGLRWILILISLVILGLIAFDGWRRIKRQQANKMKKHGGIVSKFNEEFPAKDEIVTKDPGYELETDPFNEIIHTEPENNKKAEPVDKFIPTYFVLNILPEPGQAFTGSHLLPTLLTLGLRHGEKSIFHRHEQISGNGNILFSLASATEPGIFDLDRMESQQFHGLTLFFTLPGPTHPSNALNLMMQTAKRLAQILGGRLCDDRRQYLSESTLEQQYHVRLRQALGKL